MLIARTISAAMGVDAWDDWNGVAWSPGSGTNARGDAVCHRSLPYMLDPVAWPDIDGWINQHGANTQITFVLCTRDRTLSELSRIERFGRTPADVTAHTTRAREIMVRVLESEQRSFVWSYETFMLLRRPYLRTLYSYLDIDSDFMPELADGNANRLCSGRGLEPAAGLAAASQGENT